jgi:hypothetical protein
MLVAVVAGERVLAASASRGMAASCPECGESVLLRRGARVVAHFAHRARSGCVAAGESAAHLALKAAVVSWVPAGFRVDLEVRVGARRADAVVTSPSGQRLVVECQASALPVTELRARTVEYNRAGLAVWWVFSLGRLRAQVRDHRRVRVPAELLELADGTGSGRRARGALDSGVWVSDGAGLWWAAFGDAWPKGSFYLPRTVKELTLFPVEPAGALVPTLVPERISGLDVVSVRLADRLRSLPVAAVVPPLDGEADCGVCDACAERLADRSALLAGPWGLLAGQVQRSAGDGQLARYSELRDAAEKADRYEQLRAAAYEARRALMRGLPAGVPEGDWLAHEVEALVRAHGGGARSR